ncbi:MAG: protein kinase, partial [Chloroflexi bacterium]|nr:protein kinase [Chloroflexota bacterium]
MRCPACDRENREDASFCDGCGSRLAVICPQCARELRPESTFCDSCGERLERTEAVTATPTPAPALPASFASGRYKVKSFLGEGGMKRVYLAHDGNLNRDVAIALIKSEGLTQEGIARIQREGQAMGQLGDHQHIVTAYDAGEEAGQHYIVMEYMAGGDLEALLQSTDGDGLALKDALRIGDEVCQALEHAHSKSIIHRDLKPGNIWLTENHTAKLGDFGFVLAADRSRLTQAGMMIGTPYCMPPEQALGAEVTAASDLYSLGCVLYEMVAGRPPFPGDDPTAVISQHINNAPVAPSWHTDHCPPDLEELILHLLAKAPDDRPQSATEVLEALGRVDPTERSASHTEANVLERLARGVFVGREKELDGLRKAFDEAFAGHGSIVMLVGEPGIGKTRAAQELETYARMRGAQVLWGTNHEAAGAPPYQPWVQVGRTYGSTHDPAETGQAMEGGGADLATIFPELRQLPNYVEPEPSTDPESAQFRLFDAYVRFVRAMSVRTPILIALDDLHWTDKGSLLLLQHLARELSRMRVLIVCTYRDTDLVRTHPLSEALVTLNRESGFQRIALRGLSREEVANYIRTVANVQPARSVLDKIFEETEGNPFFLSEVVNLMAQEGTLTKDSISEIAIPDGVREALGRRLNRISGEANELLQIAAVAGSEFTYDTLTLLEEHSEDELLKLIEEALDARVIEEMERPGRYRFTHAQMQETLLAELSTTRRVRLHGRIGEALEKHYGDRADERAASLAGHFVEAAMLTPRHAEKAVRYSKLAAAQSEAQAAWDVAARHYEACLTLVTEAEDKLGEDEAALLKSLGTCARNTGEYRTAWRSLKRARTLYQARGQPVGLAEATLEAVQIYGPPQRHLALVQEALAALGDGEPHLEARLLARRDWPDLAYQLDTAEVERGRTRLSELVATHGFEDVRAHILLADTFRANIAGEWQETARLARQAYERFAVLGRARDAASALSYRAVNIFILGRLDDGLAANEETRAYAREYHIRWYEESSAANAAGVLLARCDFDAFDALAEEHSTDTAYMIHAYRAARAEMAGDHERAVTLLPDPAVAGGQPSYTAQIHALRARVFLNAGQERQAREEFSRMREALRMLPEGGLFEMDSPLVGSSLTFLDEAFPVLADGPYMKAAESFVRERAESSPYFDPMAARCVGQSAGAIFLFRDSINEAEQQFRAGLEWCERERCPVEAGRCLQGLAEVAERRGKIAEALPLLDRAAALFQEHGAKLYLGRVIATKVKLQGVASGDIK